MKETMRKGERERERGREGEREDNAIWHMFATIVLVVYCIVHLLCAIPLNVKNVLIAFHRQLAHCRC